MVYYISVLVCALRCPCRKFLLVSHFLKRAINNSLLWPIFGQPVGPSHPNLAWKCPPPPHLGGKLKTLLGIYRENFLICKGKSKNAHNILPGKASTLIWKVRKLSYGGCINAHNILSWKASPLIWKVWKRENAP